MSDLAGPPPRVGVKRPLLRWSKGFEIRSPLLRYGLSVICCAIATGLGLIFFYHYEIRGMELGLLCLPVAIATWYEGIGPVDFHKFVNAVKELGVFWGVINEPPPGSAKKPT
jgi:hypothetical protein